MTLWQNSTVNLASHMTFWQFQRLTTFFQTSDMTGFYLPTRLARFLHKDKRQTLKTRI